ncbi:MAG: gliding motility protein GldB [Candidatus Azobacteroides sp.]|nr:gliding motility protein GldB [Candidatus Azobacteroides sp.]
MAIKNIILVFLFTFSCIACNQGKMSGQEPDSIARMQVQPVNIHRFDKWLYHWITSPDDQLPQEIIKNYNFFSIYTKYIIGVGEPNDPEIRSKIRAFFSDSIMMDLYENTEASYDSVSDIAFSLGKAFQEFQFYFPEKGIPTVFMHVSGLNQSVVVGENILSISIDKYQGKDYLLYNSYFKEYQIKNMVRERIVPDYLKGWLFSEFEMGEENRLIDNIIYYGKILYALQAFTEIPDTLLLGFTREELDLCLKNEKSLWHYVLENQHLYTTDYLTISKYMGEATRSAFFKDEYPAQIGPFLGWRIITQYMLKNKKVSLPELMKNQHSQEILSKSKYK